VLIVAEAVGNLRGLPSLIGQNAVQLFLLQNHNVFEIPMVKPLPLLFPLAGAKKTNPL
jgi:hypothetical protein